MNKNLIAAAVVALVFAGLGVWTASLRSRIDAVNAAQPGFAKSFEEASERIEAIRTGKPYLATCAVCRKDVSSAASTCPHCGNPRR